MTESGYQDRVRGALLGGAVGDALGWPVEFQQLHQIRDQRGPAGVTGLPSGGRIAEVTDDTQMTLFTAEGLIRGFVRGWSGGGGSVPEAVHGAYRRWLLTQSQGAPDQQPLPRPYDGWLLRQPFLYARRAPGNACLSGVSYHPEFEAPAPFGQPGPINAHSKGCGTVMRSAPFGLARLGAEQSFGLAAQCAQLTHGHPTGYLAAGAFAALVERLADGVEPWAAVGQTVDQTREWPASQETVQALARAVRVAEESEPSAEAVERVGLGWIAEECLAIAVYCLLAAASGPDPARTALLLSVNHSGDSDSTGAVCGNLVGAAYGAAALPAAWTEAVEGNETLLRVADDLLVLFGSREPAHPALGGRYPAW
ncbi:MULTISPECIES: ADP-ribosylglycohydrolase family protein [unclassified Kitasatospora]|uniref:ADP-ribosylglycohydrolase family protein n=1 Tax=unclassified Kitasatospora TaxID=2633591 RepID=UPI001AE05F06|nr:ADP-ribosylglycohydrolase family protein [Kitasatospora sp. RG8]MBP0452439.1 ADP-ribosylglycohydrolase family protein [Kitasatospora sp. RG8]